MRRTMLRTLLAACALGAIVPAQATAIVGGEIDDENAFANVAILRFIDEDATYPDDRWRCTGTLVAPDVIITAAHCTEGAERVYYSFDWQGPLGEPDGAGGTSPAGWTLAGTNIFTDPDWNGDLQNQSLDDIGIVLLDGPVTGIEPATIAPLNYLEGTRRGTLFTVAGYGIQFEKPTTGPRKRTEVSDRVRRWTTAPLSNITRDTIMLAVATRDKRGGGGTCFGDSGGPIFLDGYLVGVTSWGSDQFCKAGQAGYQRLDTEDAFEFYGEFVD